MKKKYFLLSIFLISFPFFSQCPFDNTYYTDLSPNSPGEIATDTCIFGGDLITVNVVSGERYTISLCGSSSSGSDNPQITLYDTSGTNVLGFNDDFCGLYPEISWISNYTGVLNVLVDEFGCIINKVCFELVVRWEENLSVEDVSINELIISPNPTKNILYFNNFLNKNYLLKLYDINSKLILTKKIDNLSNKINLNHLENGIYFLRIYDGFSSISKKIIKY